MNQDRGIGVDRRERLGTRIEAWAWAALVLLVFGWFSRAKLWRPDTRFTIRENVQIAEAEAWWNGRLYLPERKWDTALRGNLAFSPFPPMFSFISAGLVPLFHGVPHWFIAGALVVPVVLLAYLLFFGRTGSPGRGALLAVGLVCGTSLFPVLDKTLRGANPYFVNQTLAVLGLLIMLIECFGRRRLWLMGLGLALAALSRQMAIAYVLPYAWVAWHGRSNDRPWRRLAVVGVTVALIASAYGTLNTLKFGSPLDSGYAGIYVGRPPDRLSRDAKTYGLFSPHFVPRNLYYANLGFPRVHEIEVAGAKEIHLRPNRMGTGIWWTSPLLLWLFADMRRIVRDPLRRAWLAAAVVAAGALMFYHGTGFDQRGFNRFSMDYIPVLFALVVPGCMTGWRSWMSVVMIVWSIVYFRILI